VFHDDCAKKLIRDILDKNNNGWSDGVRNMMRLDYF